MRSSCVRPQDRCGPPTGGAERATGKTLGAIVSRRSELSTRCATGGFRSRGGSACFAPDCLSFRAPPRSLGKRTSHGVCRRLERREFDRVSRVPQFRRCWQSRSSAGRDPARRGVEGSGHHLHRALRAGWRADRRRAQCDRRFTKRQKSDGRVYRSTKAVDGLAPAVDTRSATLNGRETSRGRVDCQIDIVLCSHTTCGLSTICHRPHPVVRPRNGVERGPDIYMLRRLTVCEGNATP